MANLIITVIAIALVAVASLMGAYYGGSAFLNNQSAADASSVMNQGQQIAGAWQAYLGDNLNTPPATLTALTPNYLQSVPQYPASAGSIPAATWAAVASGGHYYGIADIGLSTTASPDPNATACLRVIKTATGTTATTTVNTGTLATFVGGVAGVGNATFGCALANASVAFGTALSGTLPTIGAAGTGHYFVYYQLS
jgi:hypothetical protein